MLGENTPDARRCWGFLPPVLRKNSVVGESRVAPLFVMFRDLAEIVNQLSPVLVDPSSHNVGLSWGKRPEGWGCLADAAE